MLSQEDWKKAYDHLMAVLAQHEVDKSIIAEVEDAAAARIKVSERDLAMRVLPGEEALSAEAKRNLELQQYRAPNNREAFVSAMEALRAILTELPAIGNRLNQLLRAETAIEIVWKPDASEHEFGSTSSSFKLEDLLINDREKGEIESVLTEIEDISGQARGKDGNAQ